MSNRGWVNQYVHLADSLPGLLLSCKDQAPSAEEIATLKEAIPTGRPLFIELGSGSGQHLIERASQNPELFFIGFELRYKRSVRTAEKANLKGLKNIFVVRCDIQHLALFFEPQSVNGIYINFPDPWERAKWKKHRMLSETTLPMFHALLKPEGFIRYKTDHEGYFDDTLRLVNVDPKFKIAAQTKDLHASNLLIDNVRTEFELLFLSKKLPIHFAEIIKVA